MATKYQELLKDDDVRRWYENLAAKSTLTASVYLRGLGLFCSLNDTSPKRILQEAKKKEFRDGFIDFVRRMEREGKTGSYIARFKKVLLSWASYNNVELKLRVNIRGESAAPTLVDERVPTKEELARILRKATPRGRVSVALMAFCALRPESLGDDKGTDGLRLGDFPEATIEGNAVRFEKAPTILIIRSNLSKARHQYFTFVPQEALTYISEYLEGRAKQGEHLGRDTPLLGFDPRGLRRNAYLRTSLVTRDIREAIRGAGFSWRPYVLRSYAATAFDIAESRGLVSHPWRQFFMGHKGDIEARYSTNKGRLPPDMVEEMREAYRRSQEYLQTFKPEIGAKEVMEEFRRQLLLVAGFSRKEIEEIDLKSLDDEEFQRMIRKRLLGERDDCKETVVPIGQLAEYMERGWEYVATLPNRMAVVKMRGDL